MKIIFVFLCLAFADISIGQNKINGVVKQSDSATLPYVNIGIKLKNIGTITNENGRFEFVIPQQYFNDTLTFSYVGFEELNIPVQSIFTSSVHVFVLHPKATQLTEVIVSGKQLKQKTIGTRSHNPLLSGTAESKDKTDIIEFAKFIDVHDKVSRIQNANLYLLGVNIDTATFRVNFYAANNGLPGDRIIDKNILERMSVKKGWLTIDLTDEDIVIDKDFFIGFEFMPEKKLTKYSLSYGAQVSGSCITRKSSLGTWEKGKGASLSAYVTLRQ